MVADHISVYRRHPPHPRSIFSALERIVCFNLWRSDSATQQANVQRY